MTKRTGQSFAAMARDELLHIAPHHKPCAKAELCAVVQVCGSLILSNGILSLRISTENTGLARKAYAAVRDITGAPVDLYSRENRRLNQRDTVLLDISGRDVVLPFLMDLGIYENGQLMRALPAFARRTCCRRAYLRGLFLSCGSITNPDRAYHMEWVFHDGEMAQSVQALLASLNIDAQRGTRKTQHIVYIKDGEIIANVLAQIGAHSALFQMENARILHEVKNNVNRAVNCETANVNRTVDASIRQIACIEYLAKTGKLAGLPASLRQAADVRLNNPQASLSELSQMTTPPATKSGINHRLRRLVALAEQAGFAGMEEV